LSASSDAKCYVCIHGHFYQPPRTDPQTGQIPIEPDAAPFANWNERIDVECYRPNAEAGHFAKISFNLGTTLAEWLSTADEPTYQHIVADENAHFIARGIGNGLAQPIHHTILPLARHRDRVCQVRWGIASFRHHFGHDPEGMWLPEMAVDEETLEILALEGIKFTILSSEQVEGNIDRSSGPYRVKLQGNRDIAVFVRDRDLSNALSFRMPHPSYVDAWMHNELSWRCHKGKLLLVATDGETFGHHHRQGIQVLSSLVTPSNSVSYELTSLGVFLDRHAPTSDLAIRQNTAWSCSHHMDRWAIGCACTPGDSRWKGALRRALDNLAGDLDHIFESEVGRLVNSPYQLRDAYIAVILHETSGPAFLVSQGLSHLSSADGCRLLDLLRAQYYRQRMYASCAFFFEDLERYEPHYAIASAAQAIALTRHATGDDLAGGFRRDLTIATSTKSRRNGAQMFDEIAARGQL